MYNYFFHKDNTKKLKEIQKEFKELLDKEIYKNAMNNVKEQYLSFYQKLVLKSAKKKKVYVLKGLKKMKEIVKKYKYL